MRNDHQSSQPSSRSGITLIEMLAVMAIMALLALMTVPSLYSLLASYGLSTGVRDVSNHLVHARSEAIARHTLTRFLVATTWTEEDGALRKFSVWRWNADSTEFDRISKWVTLPEGIIFEPERPDYILKSSYAQNDATSVNGHYALSQEEAGMEVDAFDGKPVKVQFVEFLPTGAARIPGGTLNNVIFVLTKGEAQLSSVGSPVRGVDPATPRPAKLSTKNIAPSPLTTATRSEPFRNSLGMHFVPVPIIGGPTNGKTILFSTKETRADEYKKFITIARDHSWLENQYENINPAVKVSWNDAADFCDWLTKKDRLTGKIGDNDIYRLPTDHEWSCAVGIGEQEDSQAAPLLKNSKIPHIYPWGETFPPEATAGNYYGEETKQNLIKGRAPIAGFYDSYDGLSPVGSFEANRFGLYDLGGNVWEYCQDWMDPLHKEFRVLRGAAWNELTEPILLSSARKGFMPSNPGEKNVGFRIVIEHRKNHIITKPRFVVPKVVHPQENHNWAQVNLGTLTGRVSIYRP